MNNQTNYDFEWLIVDDGSNDGTAEIVQNFLGNENFPVRYIWKENGGKHTAMNVGFENAKGEYFVCVDSDDYLVADAIEKANNLIEKVKNTDLAGFVGMCEDLKGNIIGRAPNIEFISDTIEVRDIHKIQGEPEFYKMKYLKNKKFPVFGNEKFLTEAYLFDQITMKNKLLYTDKVFMVKDFQINGLSDNEPRIRVQSPMGTLNYYKQRMELSKTLKGKFKAVANYKRFSFHSKKNIELSFKFRVMAITVLPLAYILYKKDLKKLERGK